MKHSIVEIIWQDAGVPEDEETGEGYWRNKEEVLDYQPTYCYTVGYLVHKDKEWITLAQSDANFNGEDLIGAPFQIPSKWVKQMRRLK
jgi:hypothetical protein